MKRLIAALAAAVLALTVALPALAVPLQNPQLSAWEIVCDEPVGTFTVVAKGVPGWPTDATIGTQPIRIREYAFSVWVDGAIVEGPFEVTAPPGLEGGLVGPCFIHLAGGSTDSFDIVSEEAWFQFPN
jgi:hypothetical protein